MKSNKNITLTNTIFQDNNSTDNGGALSILSGLNLYLENVIFLNNTSTNGNGGSIYIIEITKNVNIKTS